MLSKSLPNKEQRPWYIKQVEDARENEVNKVTWHLLNHQNLCSQLYYVPDRWITNDDSSDDEKSDSEISQTYDDRYSK